MGKVILQEQVALVQAKQNGKIPYSPWEKVQRHAEAFVSMPWALEQREQLTHWRNGETYNQSSHIWVQSNAKTTIWQVAGAELGYGALAVASILEFVVKESFALLGMVFTLGLSKGVRMSCHRLSVNGLRSFVSIFSRVDYYWKNPQISNGSLTLKDPIQDWLKQNLSR